MSDSRRARGLDYFSMQPWFLQAVSVCRVFLFFSSCCGLHLCMCLTCLILWITQTMCVFTGVFTHRRTR